MLDARGYSCPIPVIMVQKEIKDNNPDKLLVMVDNMTAVENIKRFGLNNGYNFKYEETKGEYIITLEK